MLEQVNKCHKDKPSATQKPGSYEVGNKKPPKNRQFGQPEGNKRSNGSWKKEDTPRYQLEQMIKMKADEVVKIANDPDAPLFSRRLARSLLKENKWNVTEAMINQVYGKPKEVVETIDTTPKAIEVQVLAPKDDAKSGKPVEKSAENAEKNS